jgi:transposase
MPSPPVPSDAHAVLVGVDTHKQLHVAVAINRLGARLGTLSARADRAGYAEMVAWARTFGPVEAFGIEGTGSYGVGLASFVRRQAIRVVEVNHCDRRKRRNLGKSDTIDADTAARSVLAGISTATPKSADGAAEMVRQIKIARDTAVKAKSTAIITLKTLIVNAPAEWREVLEPLTDRKLIDRCAALCPAELRSPSDSVQHALRALASRWLALATEIKGHDAALDAITQAAVPTLKEAFGIAADSAAEMMIVVGDNPARLKSEAAFAKLCGACPVPASTGVTNRHRLFRGGHRQANAALYRIVTVRMRWHQPTIDYALRRTAEGLSKKDIIRCLKRFVAREIYRAIMKDHGARQVSPSPVDFLSPAIS